MSSYISDILQKLLSQNIYGDVSKVEGSLLTGKSWLSVYGWFFCHNNEYTTILIVDDCCVWWVLKI